MTPENVIRDFIRGKITLFIMTIRCDVLTYTKKSAAASRGKTLFDKNNQESNRPDETTTLQRVTLIA